MRHPEDFFQPVANLAPELPRDVADNAWVGLVAFELAASAA